MIKTKVAFWRAG